MIHAAGESFTRPSRYICEDDCTSDRCPAKLQGLPPTTYAIALAARDEEHLTALEARLLDARIPHVAFREPDLNNSLTAIGIEPVDDRRMVRRLLRGYQLLGEHT